MRSSDVPRVTSGALLIGTGVLHNVIGCALGARQITDVLGDGYIGAIEVDPMRMAMFWFLGFGFLLMGMGGVMRDVELRGHRLAPWVGWALLAMGLGGGLAIPVSGFWLAVPQGLWILQRAR